MVKKLLSGLLCAFVFAAAAPAAKADGKEVYGLALKATLGYYTTASEYKLKVDIDLPTAWVLLEQAGDTLMLAYQQNSITWVALQYGLIEYNKGVDHGYAAEGYKSVAAAKFSKGEEYYAQASAWAVYAASQEQTDPEIADAYYYSAVVALEYAVGYYNESTINSYCAQSRMLCMLNSRSAVFSFIP